VQYFGSLNEPHYTSINISKRLQYKCEEAMQLLSMRQRQILDFVSAQGQYVSVHDLAEKFQVSERAIQYDIEFIESMTEVLHITLERDKANGIKILAMQQHIPNTKTSHNRVIHYAKSERILYIILKLFESSQPTSSQAFAEMVSVSRRTIVEDLKDVQKWLDEQSLALTYVKNKGFIIEGDEHNFRKAYAARVNEYFDTHTHQIGNQLFSSQDLKQIRLTVTSILMEHQYQLVQSAIDGLIYHILIAIHRTKEAYTFKIPKSEYERLSQTDQFQIATVIAQTLGSYI
jgi:activator of the mannose operon (transcriptional antiterminator)